VSAAGAFAPPPFFQHARFQYSQKSISILSPRVA
jgi:hypothetical protein